MIPYLRRSWLTLALGTVALAAFLWPALESELVYRRSEVPHGQLWRFWTCHLTHANGEHLFWNLAVFLPAGVWLEGLRRATAQAFYGLSAVAIGATVHLRETDLETYCGLSGIAAGQLVLLSLLQLRRKEEQAWFWWSILCLVAAKVVAEIVFNSSMIVDLERNVRNVPAAHVAGIATALVIAGLDRCISVSPPKPPRSPGIA